MIAAAPTYRDLIERGARAHAARTAMIVGERAYTFAEVNDRANRLAQALIRSGTNKGARVAVLLENGADSIPIDFAVSKAGLNKVPLNARLSPDEHERMVVETQCEFLLFGDSHAGRAAELIEAVPGLSPLGLGAALAGGPDIGALAVMLDPVPPLVAIDQADVVLTLFTSGTTGVLKAAQHTQASYAAICRNVLLNLFPIQPDDRMLHAASLIHASGTFVLPFWLRGACSVVLPGFAPDAYLAEIQAHRVTAINLVPTMLQMLLDHPALDHTEITSLRHIIYGASPMPRPLIARAMARLGQDRFWQYYGQTEAPLCIAVLRPEDHEPERLGACGRPAVDVDIRLLDENGHDAADGPGEIIVRMASSAIDYFNACDLSTETFADGWVRTRDIGRIDQDGYLHLLDRTSDMIITGGYNVYPREVEDALLSHPAVAEAAVVGTPDDKWVEAIVAFVVVRPEQEIDAAALVDHVAAQIASYKKPNRIVFTAELPKTVVGKLNRKALREGLGA
ncbi:class I adenylate-forming enzyme family protein [Sphingomonas sp. GB1N7]|uniref:class I adenylate-forming enzyme family protein n=1 Tax=Parasphingomonas caseinilytica TaxID=3096158 RepID=UPI002FC608C8